MEHFAIVGFGCTGFQALKALRESGSPAEIDVYSEVDLPPYNPMLTTYYVKGKIPYEAMFPFGSLTDILRHYSCHFYGNTKATALDTRDLRLSLSDGRQRTYDKILIATGATAVKLPVGDFPQQHIYTMRTVDDAVRFKKALEEQEVRRVLVVGASMVGIKIVELLHERGIQSILSDLADHIFPTAAFPTVSERIESYLRDQGVELRFGVKTETASYVSGTGHITFSDGSETTADMVVMCVGTRAACQWLDAQQIGMHRAIIVDENMRTSVPGLYAAGDCCEGADLMLGETRNLGLYANAYIQGEIAGRNMAGCPGTYEGNILHNITHFMSMDFASFGDKSLPGERVVFLDEGEHYIEATVKDGRLQCINMLDSFELSGFVKHCIIHYFLEKPQPLNEQEEGILRKSGLPNELIRILEVMVE